MENLNAVVHSAQKAFHRYAKVGRRQLRHGKKATGRISKETYHAIANFVTNRPILSIAIAGATLSTVLYFLLRNHHPKQKRTSRRKTS